MSRLDSLRLLLLLLLRCHSANRSEAKYDDEWCLRSIAGVPCLLSSTERTGRRDDRSKIVQSDSRRMDSASPLQELDGRIDLLAKQMDVLS